MKNSAQKTKRIVVSIHDVRPGTLQETFDLIDTLKAWGIHKTSLLVIPNFHFKDPIENSPHFLETMQSLENSGNEISLHSFYHLEDNAPRFESPWKAFMSKIYTTGQGEFYRLDESSAFQRIDLGLQRLSKLGINPKGFTAAAWLYSKGTHQALQKTALSYYTTTFGVQCLKSHTFLFSPVISWCYRAPLRYASNTVLPPLSMAIVRSLPLLRVALHPPDLQYPSMMKRVRTVIQRALARGYEPSTYLEAVNAHA